MRTRQFRQYVVRLGLFVIIVLCVHSVIYVYTQGIDLENIKRQYLLEKKKLILKSNRDARGGIDENDGNVVERNQYFKSNDNDYNQGVKDKLFMQAQQGNGLDQARELNIKAGEYHPKHVALAAGKERELIIGEHQKEKDTGGEEHVESILLEKHEPNAHIRPPEEGDNKEVKEGPGEMGQPVIIDKDKLSEDERMDFEKGYKEYAFNRYASDMISIHRSLPDQRHPDCRILEYEINNLPSTCVVIIFHNEAWSTLLRTVHSVIDRSEPALLKEIILVDDASLFEHLKMPLQNYVEQLDKVTLVRAYERSGLIRARLLGFEKCTADVAIFLDSHCEASKGWLPPLLSRIKENETNVVVPMIDIISYDTFGFLASTGLVRDIQVGGFNWGLIYTWHPLPETELKRVNYQNNVPLRSPTMAGGLFAISRNYFRHLGTYDSGFDTWGGENLELSFKAWMCGGTVEVIPCSHVGHVFRTASPYKWDTKGKGLNQNLVRLAEVWLDEYKEIFYSRIKYNLGEFGDVSDRKALKEQLHCRDFNWYLNNVYPERSIPTDAIAYGEIRAKDRTVCLDNPLGSSDVLLYECHGLAPNQFWLLTKKNEIVGGEQESCLDTMALNTVKLVGCHGQKGNQEFIYTQDDTIYNPNTKQCLSISEDGKTIVLTDCTANNIQKWYIQRGSPPGPKRT